MSIEGGTNQNFRFILILSKSMKNLSLNKGRPSCLCIIVFAILVFQPIKASELTSGTYAHKMQQQIMGNVADATGPLPNVTVTIKGTSISTVTDEKGNFSIAASPTDILIFSFLTIKNLNSSDFKMFANNH